MGMVKMKHINIYGPEQDPQQTLEVLAKLACFHPDKDAERINAAAGAAENLYTPLLASTLGLIKDVGGDPALQEYRGRFFEYGAVKDEVEALSAQVAERGKRQAEISAKLATYAQTKTQLYHLTGLHTSVDEIFACKYLKVRFGRIPKDSYLKLPYYDDHSFTFSEYDFDGEYYWGMYFVPESHAKEVDDIFANLYFERMWVPDFVHGTPQDALAQIMTQESELQAEQKELDNMSDIAAPADIERLREYAMQVSGEYQSQVDIAQNRVMQLLTIVTTIFLPLSLIVGWYGMNFDMPELSWEYGYPVVIVLAVVIVAVLIRYFKRKKWF